MTFERDDYNTTELGKHLADQDKWDHRREQAEEQARAEFRIGEMDDLIDERISEQAMDARNIALHAMFPDEIVKFKPSENDFIIMVEHIIDTRVDEILEEWK
jgi:hypothetical protein